MGTSDDSATVFECGSCGNVALGTGEITCCEGPMEPVGGDAPVGDATAAVDEPSLADVLGTVFAMSETEMDVCLCVMEGGEQTVSELAERIEYDRSVVSRHLNHLVDVGVLDKQRRLLERGGHVYVYSPKDPAVVRRSFLVAFLGWVQQAAPLIDDLGREKVEAIVERDRDEPQWKVYRE